MNANHVAQSHRTPVQSAPLATPGMNKATPQMANAGQPTATRPQAYQPPIAAPPYSGSRFGAAGQLPQQLKSQQTPTASGAAQAAFNKGKT